MGVGGKLKEHVSGNSGRNKFVLCVFRGDTHSCFGFFFCVQYETVCLVEVRRLAPSQFLDPGRVECGERTPGDVRHRKREECPPSTVGLLCS